MSEVMTKFTYEDIKRFIEDTSHSRCKLLSTEFTFVKDKLEIQCACGKIFKTTFDKFKSQNKRQCNKCGKENMAAKRRGTNEGFKKEVYGLVGDEYSILTDYKTTHNHVLMKHEKCGYEYEVMPSNFLRGKRCPKCNGGALNTHEDFVNKFYNQVGDEYSILGQYINSVTKLLIRHNICGFKYEVSPNGFLHGNRCPLCAGRYKDTELFRQDINRLVGEEYTLLGEYIRANKKVEIKHEKCSHVFKMTPNDFLCGHRCPKCRSSKGEKIIHNYLKDNNIVFQTQYKFNNCRNKRRLRFDFAVFDENNKLLFLIEYQGRQHFEQVNFTNTKDRFSDIEYTKQNDLIKKQYCKNNNIKLLEIPYWQINDIEIIIKDYLKQFNLIKAS
jgi:Zn finger protein HypA/HybF involved in hydrogenase expression